MLIGLIDVQYGMSTAKDQSQCAPDPGMPAVSLLHDAENEADLATVRGWRPVCSLQSQGTSLRVFCPGAAKASIAGRRAQLGRRVTQCRQPVSFQVSSDASSCVLYYSVYPPLTLCRDGSSASNQELTVRVAQLERQMSMIQQSLEGAVANTTTGGSGRRESGPHGHGSDSSSPACAKLQSVLEPDGQSFMGELSMTPNLVEVEGSGEESADNMIKLTADLPWDMPSGRNKSSRKVRGWLESVLQRHGVVADEADWREYMELFFEEIHILYPILHPPAVWQTFNGLWEYGALWPMSDSAQREEKRLSVALVCICLALGRCCVSTRMTDATGVHSSGWSLCSVAMELMQDSERIGKRAATSLLNMQIQLLRASISNHRRRILKQVADTTFLLTRSCTTSASTQLKNQLGLLPLRFPMHIF